jgi:peptidoglycan/xylan/chitin deacetylase (PgdA/CDA1 family)
MKHLFIILLCLSLTACGVSNNVPQSSPTPTQAVTDNTLLPHTEPSDELDTALTSGDGPEWGVCPIRTVDPSCPMVALTFDDGPDAVYTDQLLDILEENNAVATFFEVGSRLSTAPEAVRRAADLGCEIGSHSYSHTDMDKLSASAIQEDLDASDDAFVQVLGYAPTLLRPPYGDVNSQVKSLGLPLINWSVDTQDWKSQDAAQVIANVQAQASLDGQIILMHSIYESTVEAARTLVPWLQEQGYQLVTVSDLLTLRFGEEPQAGKVYNFDYLRYNVPALARESSQMFTNLTLAEGSPEGSSFTVKLVMTRGTYIAPTLGGGYGEVNYTGDCVLQVWQDGKLVSTCPVTPPDGEDGLLFSDVGDDGFTLMFDDYNGDGLPDFTVGQYLSSNLDMYSIFTLDEDGTVRPITTAFPIRCDNSAYSTQFDLVDGGFTVSGYDNLDGTEQHTTYLWDETIGYFIPYGS